LRETVEAAPADRLVTIREGGGIVKAESFPLPRRG